MLHAHKNNKTLKGEITREILIMIATGALILTAAGLSSSPTRCTKLLSRLGKYYRWQIKRVIKRLKSQKLIKTTNGKYVLTYKGRQKYFFYKLKSFKLAKPKKWDGKWRILIFDIPEEQRFLRDAFRQTLREWNFYKLQKSVFVTPFPCEKEIENICTESGFNPGIVLILAKKLGNQENHIREYFNL